jgi:hypothetical protein
MLVDLESDTPDVSQSILEELEQCEIIVIKISFFNSGHQHLLASLALTTCLLSVV